MLGREGHSQSRHATAQAWTVGRASGTPAEEGWKKEDPLSQTDPPIPPGRPQHGPLRLLGRGPPSLGNAGPMLGDREVRGSDTSWSPPFHLNLGDEGPGGGCACQCVHLSVRVCPSVCPHVWAVRVRVCMCVYVRAHAGSKESLCPHLPVTA